MRQINGVTRASLPARLIQKLVCKKLKGVSSYDGTIVQLLFAAAVLIPYIILTQDITSFKIDIKTVVLLILAGILLLKEDLTGYGIIGGILILGSAFFSERAEISGGKKQ